MTRSVGLISTNGISIRALEVKVLGLSEVKKFSPFRNFSVLCGKDETIKGDEEFTYVLEVPGEKFPWLLTGYGFATTVLEARKVSPLVGKFRITPLRESSLPLPDGLRIPNTTMSVDDLLAFRYRIFKVALTN